MSTRHLRLKKFCAQFQPQRRAESINFGIFSQNDIEKLSTTEIVNAGLYDGTGVDVVEYGPLDLRLGTCFHTLTCETCGESSHKCVGHFGHINLALPCYHIGYVKDVIEILKCICKSCAKILLPNSPDPQRTNIPNTYEYYKAKMRYFFVVCECVFVFGFRRYTVCI